MYADSIVVTPIVAHHAFGQTFLTKVFGREFIHIYSMFGSCYLNICETCYIYNGCCGNGECILTARTQLNIYIYIYTYIHIYIYTYVYMMYMSCLLFTVAFHACPCQKVLAF